MDIHNFDELASFVFLHGNINLNFALVTSTIPTSKDLFVFAFCLMCRGFLLLSNLDTINLSDVDWELFDSVKVKMRQVGLDPLLSLLLVVDQSFPAHGNNIQEILTTYDENLPLEQYIVKFRHRQRLPHTLAFSAIRRRSANLSCRTEYGSLDF